MIWTVVLFAILLPVNRIQSADLNSLVPTRNCFLNKQPDCNVDFVDVYPDLSKSATNLTVAETHFLLFTRRSLDKPEKLHKCAGELPPSTQFDSTQELIVILTPFMFGLCDNVVYKEWLYQILQRGNYNVLVVDYTWGKRVDYSTCILNIKIVAKQTVIVLKNIQVQTKIKKSSISFVGFSLGAHLAGLISQDFRVRKITALDPAGPGYDARLTPREDRLDRGDADLVEVWHTNAGRCLPHFGTMYDIGHVNFYINGGKKQSVCFKHSLTSLLKGHIVSGIVTALIPDICYHSQSTQYYKVSINPENCHFVGVKCKSYGLFKQGKCKCGENGENCLVMGFDTEKYIKGTIRCPQRYFVETTDTCPYCDKKPFYLEGYSYTSA